MLEEMSLDEAIALFDRQGNANKERNHDRKQIADWLRELRMLRELVKEIEFASKVTEHKDRGIDLYYDGLEDGVNRIYDYLYTLREGCRV